MRRAMLRHVVFSLIFLPLAGCGAAEASKLGACTAEGTPIDKGDCPDDGFVAADTCFTTQQAACECLSCPKSRCVASGGTPAQVSCSIK
jgi:hypothetical protein